MQPNIEQIIQDGLVTLKNYKKGDIVTPPPIPIIPGISPDQTRTLMNSRKLPQYTKSILAYTEDRCLFCNPLGPENVVIHEEGGWRMWVNPFPLAHTKHHLILATTLHVDNKEPYTHWDFVDTGKLFQWACKHFNITGGARIARFGPPEDNAGSILHRHENIIVPDGSGDVQATIAKSPIKMVEIIVRMHIFEKLRCGASVTDLSEAEQKLVENRLS